MIIVKTKNQQYSVIKLGFNFKVTKGEAGKIKIGLSGLLIVLFLLKK